MYIINYVNIINIIKDACKHYGDIAVRYNSKGSRSAKRTTLTLYTQ